MFCIILECPGFGKHGSFFPKTLEERSLIHLNRAELQYQAQTMDRCDTVSGRK